MTAPRSGSEGSDGGKDPARPTDDENCNCWGCATAERDQLREEVARAKKHAELLAAEIRLRTHESNAYRDLLERCRKALLNEDLRELLRSNHEK